MPTRRRGPRPDADFHAEIDAHLALEVDRLVADGLTPEEARARAARSFGSVLAARERYYEARRRMWLDQLVQDLRYAWRGLRRSRAFVATTVLTLAAGLGLITSVFTVFNAYVLRPFAVRDPYALFLVGWRAQDAGSRLFTWREFEELRGRRDLFDDAVADTTRVVPSNGIGLQTAFVSGNYFDALGVRLRLGRGLAPVDARAPGGEPVAVLSDRAWSRLFDRDPGVLGRQLDLNGTSIVVIGVARPEFTGMDEETRDLWLPLTMLPVVVGRDLYGPDQPRELGVIVRVRPELTADQASAALLPFAQRASARRDVTSVRAVLSSQATPAPISLELIALLSPVFAAFGLVLAAACANVSNVMLARANARHREIGVRLALGASRWRLVRQLLTEGLLIALIAGLAGLALTALLLRAGEAALFALLPPVVSARATVLPLDIDGRVFLFALLAAAATTMAFALVPALRATRVTLTDAMRGQAGRRVSASRLRGLLVAGQVAVSLVLLIGALTVTRNGLIAASTDLGYDLHGVVSINQRLTGDPLVARVAAALRDEPRVAAIAATSTNPLFEMSAQRTIALTSPQAAGGVGARITFVSPEYFDVLRLPIVRGRAFAPAEARTEAAVGIVSAATAAALWPGRDPVGQVLRLQRAGAEPGSAAAAEDEQTMEDLRRYAEVTVVGVAKDVVSGLIYGGVDGGHLYLPTSADGRHAAALLARGRSAQDLRPDALQAAFARVHPDPTAFEAIPLDQVMDGQVFPVRAASWVGALLGAVALGLSISGLYGVLTYTLGQRTREIGIRMALGATSSRVTGLVMRQSARLAGVGAAIGLVLAFAAMQTLRATMLRGVAMLPGVSIVEPRAFAAGLVLVLVAAALAAYGPARRAARVDPARTLRAEG